jgi:transposase
LPQGSHYLLLYAGRLSPRRNLKNSHASTHYWPSTTALHQVYLLKEDLRLFWSHDSKKEAKRFIEQWIEETRAMNDRHVATFANAIESYLDSILAWYDHPSTTGPPKVIKNEIKVLKRMAYGYRGLVFALRFLFLHETNFRLAGS